MFKQKNADKFRSPRKEKAMSVSGISGSSLYNPQSVQNSMQQFRKEFQQLGQDLQSGNLSSAQSDFATLQSGSQTSSRTSNSSSQTNNPVAQDFNQLSRDLQSGNLSAAQQDYTKVQQDFQSQGTQAHGHHHHHGGGSSSGSSESSQISQLFSQLGQALQAGNLSTAQQTYSSLQQDFQQMQSGGVFSTQSQTGSTGVSLSA
jgi:outer membrane protein assembly factor BamD (BamD/ComL family)